MKQPTSDYQEVDERFEEADFCPNEVSQSAMDEVKSFLHSELDRVREETIKECLEAVKSTIKFDDMEDYDIDSYQAGHIDAAWKAIVKIKELAKDIKEK